MLPILDLFKSKRYDFVDTPFWTLMQIKVKYLNEDLERPIQDLDKGKVKFKVL